MDGELHFSVKLSNESFSSGHSGEGISQAVLTWEEISLSSTLDKAWQKLTGGNYRTGAHGNICAHITRGINGRLTRQRQRGRESLKALFFFLNLCLGKCLDWRR